jgi:outer membrane protein OmpA-like peptidoglycan-associated protein
MRPGQLTAAELVRDGVAQSEITVHGYGETNPLIPT